MNKSNERPSMRTMAKDNSKSNIAHCKLSYEIKERLIHMAGTVTSDAYDQIDSKKLILKLSNELAILRQKNEMGAPL